MSDQELSVIISKIMMEIGALIPEYMNNPVDKSISDGNVAVCFVAKEGNILGKMFGTDKNRSRQSFKIAWTKASQVWITGMKTGEYERKVFNKEVDEYQYGIQRPDFIGWDGGQPIALKDGNTLSVGFSGFRGTSDLEIVQKAVAKTNL
jgi:glc operon protein GlcG